MAKRVFLAGLYHETHTFLSNKTGMDIFRSMIFRTGSDVVTESRGSLSPSDGVIEVADAEGWELVPSIQISGGASGMVTQEVVDTFLARCFADLEAAASQLDGVALVLHGAMVSEQMDDVEGVILAGIRQRLAAAGKDIPVVAVLDLHGNVSAEMAENATMLVAYRENPHTDARQTGVRAGRFLARLMDGMTVSQVHLETPYVLPPTGVGTADNPMKAVLARARQIEEADPEVVNINVMAGYAYADIAMCGFSVAAATTGDPGTAMGYLKELQGVLEAHLAEGYPAEDTLDEALAKADALPPGKGPILLIEAADNIGGGTPGDATGILAPLLASGRKGILAAIADPESVKACQAAGLGAEVSLMVGGKTDAFHGAPVPFAGRVRHLSDGRFTLENVHSHAASMGGIKQNMRASAVVENDQAILLLTSVKLGPMDLGQYHSQGVAVEDATYVIVKAAVSHRAAYDPIERASFRVDSEGLCTSSLTRLPYAKLTGKQMSAG